MSARKLPDYRLKQKLLYIDKTSAASLISYGDLYLEAGAHSDALDFYIQAKHRAGMEKIKDIACQNGDTFLFQKTSKALGVEPQNTDWEKIASRAAELKKYLFAGHALEKSNNLEMLNALQAAMKAEET